MLNSNARVTYWLKNQPVQNFGDLLSDLLFEALSARSLLNWRQGRIRGDYDVVRLIGSVISDWHIERDLEYCRTAAEKPIAFWGCGLRTDEPIRQELMARCTILGVRGPLTRDVLGLSKNVAIGDPGLLIPFLYTPQPQTHVVDKVICVPHFLDPKSDDALISMTGCDLILRPNLPGSRESMANFIDLLVSAKLVLAGALHAAIVAFAYGRPFAYFDSGFIDVPFKWADFGASIRMPLQFVQTADAGANFFRLHSSQFRMPRLGDLLACAPFRPSKGFVSKVVAGLPPSAAPGKDRMGA